MHRSTGLLIELSQPELSDGLRSLRLLVQQDSTDAMVLHDAAAVDEDDLTFAWME